MAKKERDFRELPKEPPARRRLRHPELDRPDMPPHHEEFDRPLRKENFNPLEEIRRAREEHGRRESAYRERERRGGRA